MLKWVVAGLALLNTGLFLWATGHKGLSAGDVAAARPLVNADAMRLLGEMTAAQPAAREGRIPGLCFRVGPFPTESDMSRIGERFAELRIPYRQRTVPPREIRAHRVYIGPYTTAVDIQAQRNLLRASGVSEHYVKHEGGGRDIISLGLFAQKKGAETLVKQLQAKNIKALVRPEDRVLASNYWVELRIEESDQRARAALEQISWPGSRAKLRQYPCI